MLNVVGNAIPFRRRTDGEQPIPAPDFLFDTRTGLVITDSVAGEQISIKDFRLFTHKPNAIAGLTMGCDTGWAAPVDKDFTMVGFIKPNQGTNGNTELRGITGGGSYLRFNHATKQITGFLNGGLIGSTTTMPDSANYLNNTYMVVYRMKYADQLLNWRCYNTSSNYIEGNRTGTLPAASAGNFRIAHTVIASTTGIVFCAFHDKYLNDQELSNYFNGTIAELPIAIFPMMHGEGLRAYGYNCVNGTTFSAQDGAGNLPTPPYYNQLTNLQIGAYQLEKGYFIRGVQTVGYNPSGSKAHANITSDLEYPSSNCIHNLAPSRLYFDGITNASLKALFDKSNRTYWKASIESEEAYLDAGGGYYGVWTPEQLMRDFIKAHAQSGHENKIFTSLRTSNGVVNGQTAIRVWLNNLT